MKSQEQPINLIYANTYFFNGIPFQNRQRDNNPTTPQSAFLPQNIPFPVVPLIYNNNNQSYITNSQIILPNSNIPNQNQYFSFLPNNKPSLNQ